MILNHSDTESSRSWTKASPVFSLVNLVKNYSHQRSNLLEQIFAKFYRVLCVFFLSLIQFLPKWIFNFVGVCCNRLLSNLLVISLIYMGTYNLYQRFIKQKANIFTYIPINLNELWKKYCQYFYAMALKLKDTF